DLAAAGSVEARCEVEEGRLARAGGAHDRGDRAGRDLERDSLQRGNRLGAVRVGLREADEAHAGIDPRRAHCRGRGHGGPFCQGGEFALTSTVGTPQRPLQTPSGQPAKLHLSMQIASSDATPTVRSFAARDAAGALRGWRGGKSGQQHRPRETYWKDRPMTATAAVPTIERGGVAGVISRRPLLSFFILANALSWTAWIPFILSNTG